jgi:hypothetical protein
MEDYEMIECRDTGVEILLHGQRSCIRNSNERNSMKISRSAVSQVVVSMLECPKLKRASNYVSPDLVINGCRMHPATKRSRSTTIVLSIGKPNYSNREFIKLCKKAGEPFPAKKMQLRWYK